MEIVFIGFGDTASHIANDLKVNHSLRLGAFDTDYDHPLRGQQLHTRSLIAGVRLYRKLSDAVATARYIICLTPGSRALAVAQQVLPLLGKGQYYIDMTSASPAVKQAINILPRASDVGFCDAAIMGSTPEQGHQVPLILAGNAAQQFTDDLTPYGMVFTVLEAEPGVASTIRTLRNIVVMGLPQLLLEALCAAEKIGAKDILISSLGHTLKGKTVEQLAETFCTEAVVHAAQYCGDMASTVATLRAIDADATMSVATLTKLHSLVNSGLSAAIAEKEPLPNFREAVKLLTFHSEEKHNYH
ncbi:MAG: NAD(P)-binding domain-containing protein [Scandinavium sp.]|uniref:NAD(P)-binding domain-containing protein n=1 Tax=Scandinavium sp. TaxID=2830653 RepID=UPI003F339913